MATKSKNNTIERKAPTLPSKWYINKNKIIKIIIISIIIYGYME